MTKRDRTHRRIHDISGVRDKSFTPYETFRRIPWLVYSILIALGIWGGIALFTSDDHAERTTAETTTTASTPTDGAGDEISAGHALFNQFCATCHQEQGIGLAEAIPPLAGSSIVLEDPRVPAGIVLMGLSGPVTVAGAVFDGRMPTFRETLTDREIAAIVTYIRQAWTNDAGPITTEQVAGVRARLKDQSTPLTGEQQIQKLRQTVTSSPATSGAADPVQARDSTKTAADTSHSEAR